MCHAQVLDVRDSDEKGREYFIHYNGWNKKYGRRRCIDGNDMRGWQEGAERSAMGRTI
jgi:hypothetical protein